jgi:hypothetical protein
VFLPKTEKYEIMANASRISGKNGMQEVTGSATQAATAVGNNKGQQAFRDIGQGQQAT